MGFQNQFSWGQGVDGKETSVAVLFQGKLSKGKRAEGEKREVDGLSWVILWGRQKPGVCPQYDAVSPTAPEADLGQGGKE